MFTIKSLILVEKLVEKHHFEEVQKNNPLKFNELF